MKRTHSLNEMACFHAYRLHHALGRYYQSAFAGTHYTYAKYLVLKALQEHGEMSLSELSTKLGVEANTLSPLVKKMATFAVIERLRDPEDERRIVLRLTTQGGAALKEADAIVNANFAALDITEDEGELLIQLIGRLRKAVEKSSHNDDRESVKDDFS